jgi:hypothetical protein
MRPALKRPTLKRPVPARTIPIVPVAPKPTPGAPRPAFKPYVRPPVPPAVQSGRLPEGVQVEGSDYRVTIQRYMDKIKNPLTAIRAFCVHCSGGSLKEVTECRLTKCALYQFRHGTNPLHKRSKASKEAGEEGGEGEGE